MKPAVTVGIALHRFMRRPQSQTAVRPGCFFKRAVFGPPLGRVDAAVRQANAAQQLQGFARCSKAARLMARRYHHNLAALGLNIDHKRCTVPTQRNAYRPASKVGGLELLKAEVCAVGCAN